MVLVMRHRVRASRAVDPQGFVFRIESSSSNACSVNTSVVCEDRGGYRGDAWTNKGKSF